MRGPCAEKDLGDRVGFEAHGSRCGIQFRLKDSRLYLRELEAGMEGAWDLGSERSRGSYKLGNKGPS